MNLNLWVNAVWDILLTKTKEKHLAVHAILNFKKESTETSIGLKIPFVFMLTYLRSFCCFIFLLILLAVLIIMVRLTKSEKSNGTKSLKNPKKMSTGNLLLKKWGHGQKNALTSIRALQFAAYNCLINSKLTESLEATEDLNFTHIYIK